MLIFFYVDKLLPNNEIKVTIVELIRTPDIIAMQLLIFDKPNRYAASAPVQTPVRGNGIPTKIIRP